MQISSNSGTGKTFDFSLYRFAFRPEEDFFKEADRLTVDRALVFFPIALEGFEARLARADVFVERDLPPGDFLEPLFLCGALPPIFCKVSDSAPATPPTTAPKAAPTGPSMDPTAAPVAAPPMVRRVEGFFAFKPELVAFAMVRLLRRTVVSCKFN
jgi:hypothetical protein